MLGHRSIFTATLVAALFFLAAPAHARIGLVVGEPFGSFGTMMPAGHASIYLDHLCVATPTQLRPCHPGELGAVVSRYHDLRHPDLDWMATPASVFFYGVDEPTSAPQYMTAALESELREDYREAHLREIVPDRIDRHGNIHRPRYGDWEESIGAAFDRRLFLYTLNTTPDQDIAILHLLNTRPNTRRYSLFRANCADFAADLLNIILPDTFHRNTVADFDMMSPKQLAHLITLYGHTHPASNFNALEVPQVPGTLRRSRPLRGAAETFLKTKRYLATLLLIQPEAVLTTWIVYETSGKSSPARNPHLLTPSENFGLTLAPSPSIFASSDVPTSTSNSAIETNTPAATPSLTQFEGHTFSPAKSITNRYDFSDK